MDFDWKPEYDELADRFMKQHYSGRTLSAAFPSMRESYPWGEHRPPVGDARVPAKNNDEYHGLETHANQYHLTAQYEFAYHHWLMAAWWRIDDAKANNFRDPPHQEAIRYCVRHALYNKALYEWQQTGSGLAPQPEVFGLTRRQIDAKDAKAQGQIMAYLGRKDGKTPPRSI
ncbi:MAG: hypothetical protein ACLQO1_02540 [Steroidobacteraceae bacterium]|jgi:hypothetical protein